MSAVRWELLPGGLCGCGEGFAHFPRGFEWCRAPLKDLGMQILNHALVIADGAARSDVELYAHGFEDEAGHPVYDTTRHQDAGGSPEDLAIVERAIKYIELRGDVWPWTLKRQLGAPHLVRFVPKE